LGLQLPVQSVPITTKVVSLSPTHGEVYSIQHYEIKTLGAGWWFSQGTPISSTNKTDRHDMTEILLKVALNTINQTKPKGIFISFWIYMGLKLNLIFSLSVIKYYLFH